MVRGRKCVAQVAPEVAVSVDRRSIRIRCLAAVVAKEVRPLAFGIMSTVTAHLGLWLDRVLDRDADAGVAHHLPHFAALRAKFAFFFMAGEAPGSARTERALA